MTHPRWCLCLGQIHSQFSFVFFSQINYIALNFIDQDKDNSIKIVLADDGTEVDDEDYFQTLPAQTGFVALVAKQQWKPGELSSLLLTVLIIYIVIPLTKISASNWLPILNLVCVCVCVVCARARLFVCVCLSVRINEWKWHLFMFCFIP